ncbi:MAG: aminomethyl-transferring glycine dehydrogenase subunit GcvPB [Candidatus Omnitrophica bacterium]|nr:aminomethyl-transferring glycine dehydrogenase subunit GcvPB [Candidatus Omnitrophota bacterium]
MLRPEEELSKLIFEKRSANTASWLPSPGKEAEEVLKKIPKDLLREKEPEIPSLSELDVVRHFTNLSRKNFCVDTHFYPLGSCTMKYNPKSLDAFASFPGFADVHPYADEEDVQGALQLLHEMEIFLSEITGMDAFTLQPAAGAHGEFCGLLMAAAYHHSKGEKRTKVLIPDSAHGTNPASAALCGYEVVQIKTNPRGHVDPADLKSKTDASVACFMMTNPNTLGLFEEDILEISRLVHEKGGLLYYDGANMNALLGVCRPGDMGFDIVHLNLHKTFAVPHGSGGPGSGPVGVKKRLAPFLPVPRIRKEGDRYRWEHSAPSSIGKLRSFYGNFGAVVRSYAYIRALGKEGLRAVSENAILNANYLKKRLEDIFDEPFDGFCMHEFVLSAARYKKQGVKALDIAKRLLDFGVYAPTIYFPLIVEEALMVEPTETESKETLDRFVEILRAISREIQENPEKVQGAPYTTPVGRIDEVRAARQPNLRYHSK